MPDEESAPREHTQYHKDGSVWAKGPILGDTPTGYWEWFRKDGTKMRSGYFDKGEQVGNWTTYDRNGDVYKVTDMRRKKGKARQRQGATMAPLSSKRLMRPI